MGKDHKKGPRHADAETIEFFDSLAENWDSQEQNPTETLNRLEQLQGLLNLHQGDDLLEVGCGTGQLTAWLAEQVAPGRMTAVDFSPRMLRIAKTKCSTAAFRLLDVCRDELEPRQFDVVFCFHCLPHFHDMPAGVNNLARSLKPGGRLLVLHLQSRQEVNRFHDQIGGPVAGHYLPDEHGWQTLLDDASLEKTRLIDEAGLYLLEAKKAENR